MDKTMRQRITDYQNEILNNDLQPDRASVILTEMASLFGNVIDEVTMADIEYNKELSRCFETEEKANRAKIKAETSKQYMNRRIARDTKELTVEIMRSLKYFLRAKEDEVRASRSS